MSEQSWPTSGCHPTALGQRSARSPREGEEHREAFKFDVRHRLAVAETLGLPTGDLLAGPIGGGGTKPTPLSAETPQGTFAGEGANMGPDFFWEGSLQGKRPLAVLGSLRGLLEPLKCSTG
jgi:hypothetical protein